MVRGHDIAIVSEAEKEEEGNTSNDPPPAKKMRADAAAAEMNIGSSFNGVAPVSGEGEGFDDVTCLDDIQWVLDHQEEFMPHIITDADLVFDDEPYSHHHQAAASPPRYHAQKLSWPERLQ